VRVEQYMNIALIERDDDGPELKEPTQGAAFWSGGRGRMRVCFAVFFLCVILCAGAVFTLATYTRPMQDDFCRATVLPDPADSWTIPPFLQTPGILHMAALTYLNWSGRWAGTGLEILLLSTMPIAGAYPYLVIGLVAIQLFLLYFGIWFLSRDHGLALYLSALIAIVYWATMPSPQQGLFWIPGAIESQLPLTLILLLFALALSAYSNTSRRATVIATTVAAALAFAIPAFHELAGAIVAGALSVIVLHAMLSESSRRNIWLILWTSAVLGFLLVYLAPGNAVRMSAIPNRGNTWITLKGSLSLTHSYLLPWCLDFKHWLLALLVILHPRVELVRKKLSGWSSFRAVASFAAIWLLLLAIAIAAGIWNLGKLPPGRTMNLLYGIFLIGWVALAFLVSRPNPEFVFQSKHRAAVLSTALLLFSALAVTSENTVVGISDVAHGRARAWDRELDQRFATLTLAERNVDLLVPTLAAKPNSLAWFDITSKPGFWSNRCVARYFGVKSVRIAAPVLTPK
jgi:hypothetical protein